MRGFHFFGFLWVAIRVSEFWVLGSRFRGFIRFLLLLLFPYPVMVVIGVVLSIMYLVLFRSYSLES